MKYGLLMAGILIMAIFAFVFFVNHGKHIKESAVRTGMGQHRLRLLIFGKDEGFIFLGITFGNGYNFHSLVWEEMGKEGWVTKRVITQADFQSGQRDRPLIF